MANKKPTSMFSAEAIERHQEQEALTNKLTAPVGSIKPERKVRMNITLASEYKDRLNAAASKKGLSASVLIQMWIDENCV